MEPRYQSLVVALVPQPRQIPPPAFDTDDLQRIFSEVIRSYPYQSFEFMYGARGAQFNNGPEDSVEIRPALFQVQAKMDGPDLLTAPMAESKAVRILKVASERLKVETFLQCAIQVVASVDAPGEDAKAFVAERLMHDGDQANELGPDYFGAGVRFRSIMADGTGENSLSIEPFLQDNTLVYLDHQIAHVAAKQPLAGLDQVSTWIGDAFEFLAGPTMRLLTR
jgi:hypothetical protein